MEGWKWENLQRDCLVKVFEKVGLKGLATNVPLVCKSWHKASLDPLCWKHIDFPNSIPTRELKLAVDCSRGAAIHVKFPCVCSLEDLIYVAQKCPGLESVGLPGMCVLDCSCLIDSCACKKNIPTVFASSVAKWKNLKYLSLGTIFYFPETMIQASLHCKNLVGLSIAGRLGHPEAFAIISLFPKIKYFEVKDWSNVTREGLIAVLIGCKELEEVKACNCLGFDADDEGILKLASRLQLFKAEGSKVDMFADLLQGYASITSPF